LFILWSEDTQVYSILFLIRANQFFIKIAPENPVLWAGFFTNQRNVAFNTKGDTQTVLATLRPLYLGLPLS